MKTIDLIEARTVALQVLKEEGDRVYVGQIPGQCTYTDKEGNASCVVGHVIFRIAPEELKSIWSEEWGEILNGAEGLPDTFGAMRINHHVLEHEYTFAARSWLSVLQHMQDMQNLWSESIEAADGDIVAHLWRAPDADFSETERKYIATLAKEAVSA